ncbi:DUF2750 domain-containing protein [Aeromicrobium tamlense]|uniref:DUF2750 domain-containing protein n=1 Tax=Aeromicrobium tamlense TaxID=375541 RepID=A0A8I0KM19_9ACTN|nr:DUF2750 domain-containing protein [Aeromicrobium tamlense]
MSISAAHVERFYTEASDRGEVWTIRDAGGYPAPEDATGRRAMPFWSLRSRVELVISSVEAYADFEAVPIPLDVWRERWLPGLGEDKMLVGLNWAGPRATGWDLSPTDVESRFLDRNV